ncbi:MAG: hypothetical protein JO197_06415 [Acidobacteria bacterium]|nr:hypothetical protein [Acidobacteriota bacterium]
MNARFAAVAMAALFSVSTAPAQQFEQLMERGEQADLRGKTIKAASQFKAAVEVAKTPEDRVRATFAYIDALKGAQTNAGLDPAAAGQVEAAYQKALKDAQGMLSFKAHNDYAVFLLDRGDHARAQQIFADGVKDCDSVSQKTAARYRYNFALSQARSGQMEPALATYRRALENDPTLEPASNAAFNIVNELGPQRGAAEAVDLIELLIDRNQLGEAEKRITQALDPARGEWQQQSAPMEKLVRLFARWAAKNDNASETVKTLLPPLIAAAANGGEAARERAAELQGLWERSDLPLSFESNAELLFPHWPSAEERNDLSHLAMIAADDWELANSGQAMARYIVAWQLDPANVDAIVYCAALLDLRDPSPEREALFDSMITALFESKRAAADDHQALLRLHMVLGSIFEKRGQWGSLTDPRSAAFQYWSAFHEYESLRASEADAPVYPGVHANLGAAYQHIGMAPEAWQQYVSAAELNLTVRQIAAAELMLERADSTGYVPTAEETAHINQVRTLLRTLHPPRPPTDVQIAQEVKERLEAHPEIDASQIDVAVRQGVVTLSAQQTASHSTLAVTSAVLPTEGVTEVQVEVASPPP